MIIFEGNVSKEVSKEVLKDFLKPHICLSVFIIILGIGLSLIAVLADVGEWLLIMLIFMACVCVGLAIFAIIYPIVNLKKNIPSKIDIDDDNYITCYFKNFTEFYGKDHIYQSIEYVKKVKDCGNYYHIYFSYPHKIFGCICQKDLLKEGTIEEFEECFKETLVKAY